MKGILLLLRQEDRYFLRSLKSAYLSLRFSNPTESVLQMKDLLKFPDSNEPFVQRNLAKHGVISFSCFALLRLELGAIQPM